jgi:NitT/TauT family transport system permease protein
MTTAVLTTHSQITNKVQTTLIIGWVSTLLLIWFLSPISLLPRPFEVVNALGLLWQQGLGVELLSSVEVNIEAIACAIVIGLGLTYLSTLPFFRFPVEIIGKLRFLSLTGITVFFMFTIGGGHALKVALLAFVVTTFFVHDMLRVVENIPQDSYDYAETLGLSKFQMFWQVVVRGTLTDAFDSIRMNAAMSWMMLTMVEGLSRAEGGVGIILLDLNRQMKFDAILAVQILMLLLGMGQDYLIKHAKNIVCPYTVH